MPILETTQDARENVVRELTTKLNLETRYIRQLRELFNTIAKDIKKQYAYAPEFAKIIRNLYLDAGNKFIDDIRKNPRPEPQFEIPKDLDKKIQIVIDEYTNQNADAQGNIIASTTNDEANTAVQNALEVSALLDTPLGNEEIGELASREVARRGDIRSEFIAATEVQNITEFTKEAEALALVGVGAYIGLKKRWNAILDSRTRVDHVVANGQVVKVGQAFIVGGYEMQHPGDRTFAPPSQYINCRCSSDFVINS